MADVKVKFSSDTTGVQQGVSKIQDSIGGLKSSIAGFSKAFAGIAGVAAVGAGIGIVGKAAYDGIKDILNFGGTISDLNAITGISKGNLVAYRKAFEDASIPVDQLGTVIAKLSNKLETPDTATLGWLERFGISIGDVSRMNPEQRFEGISKGISGLALQTDKLKASSVFFGKMGSTMQPLFATTDAIADAKKYVGGLAGNMEKYADQFDNVGDAIDGLQYKFKQFFAGLVGNNIGSFTALATGIKNLDLTNVGNSVGETIKSLTNAFQNGELGTAIWNGFQFALKQLYVGLVAVSIYAGEKFAATVLDRLGDKLGIPKGPQTETGKAVSSGLMAVLFPLTLPKTISDYQRISNGESVPSSGDSFSSILNDTRKSLEPALNSVKNLEAFNKAGRTPITGEGLKGTTITVTTAEWQKLIAEVKQSLDDNNTIANLKEFSKNHKIDFFIKGDRELMPEWLKSRNKDILKTKDQQDFVPDAYKPILSSLARIGGASAFTKNPLVNLQQRANDLLLVIAKNTSNNKGSVPSWG